jgi:hypothetical protein
MWCSIPKVVGPSTGYCTTSFRFLICCTSGCWFLIWCTTAVVPHSLRCHKLVFPHILYLKLLVPHMLYHSCRLPIHKQYHKLMFAHMLFIKLFVSPTLYRKLLFPPRRCTTSYCSPLWCTTNWYFSMWCSVPWAVGSYNLYSEPSLLSWLVKKLRTPRGLGQTIFSGNSAMPAFLLPLEIITFPSPVRWTRQLWSGRRDGWWRWGSGLGAGWGHVPAETMMLYDHPYVQYCIVYKQTNSHWLAVKLHCTVLQSTSTLLYLF